LSTNKILGIDASTVGSGGAKRHLIELLKNYDPNKFKFSVVKIYGGVDLLNSIPNYQWLVKEYQTYLDKNIIYRIFWQLFLKEKIIKKSGINILFSPFGTYTGNFKPYISMSRNMLIFDKSERKRFPLFSFMRLKLKLLFLIQKKSFKNSAGIIFISKYAKNTISTLIDIKNVNQVIVHHGVSNIFHTPPNFKIHKKIKLYKILYVSSIWPYKHHLNVVKAISKLHRAGYNITLDIVGSPDHIKTATILQDELNSIESKNFIFWHKKIGLEEIDFYYKNADAFIFASTCENMPNILIEAMASGLPICCSNFAPMPEFIEDAAVYFDPTDVSSIENAVTTLILNRDLCDELSKRSFDLSKKYTWQKCANETFTFINQILNTNGKYI
jgi:glycosyltransferase involved in cell wall biosynthesis